MAELVTIPVSFIELMLEYERRDLRLWVERAHIIQTILDALKPWSPNIDDVEPLSAGKLSEQGFTLKIPAKRVSFFFGPASCRFTREAVDWDRLEETIAMLDSAVSAFIRFSGTAIAAQRATVGLHLQPRTAPFMNILGPFLAPQLVTLEREPVKTMAAVAKWDKRRVTLDGSGVLANGLFLKLEREFDGKAGYEDMAQQLRNDEEELFRILGVEEDRS
jgi:hypothetical protein